ncbi:hypothetical protein KBY26_11420 [Ruegeria pomeroyi]|nr:hypothetical protein [Ruegeria pomeroyi]
MAGSAHHPMHHDMRPEAQRQRGQKAEVARKPAERSARDNVDAKRDEHHGTTGQHAKLHSGTIR